jgi:hypothetical protein
MPLRLQKGRAGNKRRNQGHRTNIIAIVYGIVGDGNFVDPRV